ncbi:MAG: hypothetical protein ABH860_03180 [bacterium]
MDPYITGINPLQSIGPQANVSKVKTRADAEREFASMFIAQILKETFKSQSSMFGKDKSIGMFSDNLYNDILIAKISSEIAQNKSFGFDKLMAGSKL